MEDIQAEKQPKKMTVQGRQDELKKLKAELEAVKKDLKNGGFKDRFVNDKIMKKNNLENKINALEEASPITMVKKAAKNYLNATIGNDINQNSKENKSQDAR